MEDNKEIPMSYPFLPPPAFAMHSMQPMHSQPMHSQPMHSMQPMQPMQHIQHMLPMQSIQYPLQYPMQYPPNPPFSGPIIPGPPLGYTPLQSEVDYSPNSQELASFPLPGPTSPSDRPTPNPEEYKNLSFIGQLKVIPANMFYVLTGKVAQLRTRKHSASIRTVAILYGLLFLYAYLLLSDKSFTPILFAGVIWFFLQTCIFAIIGSCIRGLDTSPSNSFCQFCYFSILFGIPLALLGSVVLLPIKIEIGGLVLLFAMIYSILSYVFPLQSVYDVSIRASFVSVLVYLLLLVAVLLGITYLIADSLRYTD